MIGTAIEHRCQELTELDTHLAICAIVPGRKILRSLVLEHEVWSTRPRSQG